MVEDQCSKWCFLLLTNDKPIQDGQAGLVEIPDAPVLKEPDRDDGEGEQQGVKQQGEAVQAVQLRLLFVDAQLGRHHRVCLVDHHAGVPHGVGGERREAAVVGVVASVCAVITRTGG